MPLAPGRSSTIRSFQIPDASLPSNAASCCSGLNHVDENGALAFAIGVFDSSLNVVDP